MAKQGRTGLGLWDRLVLLIAWVVTCGLVYLLGIYVGKGMQERLLGSEDRVVRLPVTNAPPRGAEQPRTQKELTFYDTLVHDRESGRPARGSEASPHPAAPIAAAVPAAPAKPAPPATVAPAATRPIPPSPAVTPAAVRTPPPIVPVPARPLPTPEAAPTPSPGPLVRASARPALAALPPPGSTPAGEPGARAGVGTGNWTVLANPTRSHEEADGLARQLRGRGYAASVVRVLREGDTWYRVAVGRFASSEQATEMMQRLREREGVAHVFVAAE